MAIYVVSLIVRRNHPHHSRAVLGAAALAVLGVAALAVLGVAALAVLGVTALAVLGVAALAVLGVAGVDGEVKVVQRQAERRFTNSEFIRILKECQATGGRDVSRASQSRTARPAVSAGLVIGPAYRGIFYESPRTHGRTTSPPPVTEPLGWPANRG